MVLTLCDPLQGDTPQILDYSPDTKSGFMFWRDYLREIADIHETTNGKQIQLLDI